MIKDFETKLGNVKIDTEKIITFEYGIPGFESHKKFAIIELESTYPIMWLVSLEDKNVAFPVTFPKLIRNDYEVVLPEDIVAYLQLEDPEDAVILSILTIPQNKDDITINLAAPIIISKKNNKGLQFLIENNNYKIRHYLVEEMERNSELLSVQKDGD
ncbi:flagellar assembly protein FliW [Petrotoga sp. 9PWA.NaAc.5.4]|uniref:flagellar assembly protein FliW n=1 Tax=Petrotoga sp. 9PWA.NaAc.5.4 TaxID=1434328 RepID=UPI000CB8099C|nr:flagellar assembly protein FliW [Petrotoga sp. 9PWA.NaAc.5.4]PNR94730.1 flagellar assembly protein FliW [Petrotoga sp. 9PWA.NaAc.5.4]